jgi:hypothetical protein
MDFKSLAGAALGGKTDVPLSAQSQSTLQELIGKGVFNDKAQFVEFATKSFMEYKMKGSSPAALTDIVKGSPMGKGASDMDIKDKLLPLMTEVFTFAGKNKMGL